MQTKPSEKTSQNQAMKCSGTKPTRTKRDNATKRSKTLARKAKHGMQNTGQKQSNYLIFLPGLGGFGERTAGSAASGLSAGSGSGRGGKTGSAITGKSGAG